MEYDECVLGKPSSLSTKTKQNTYFSSEKISHGTMKAFKVIPSNWTIKSFAPYIIFFGLNSSYWVKGSML